jgi:hypothetical protein
VQGAVVAQSPSKPTPAEIERAVSKEKTGSSLQSHHAPGARAGVLPPAPQGGGSDACATPEVLVGTGSVSFDTSSATTGTQGQAEAQCNLAGAGTAILNDVWFTWNAPSTGLARIRTCALTMVDTKIAVYAGTACPTTGSAIACNDDACGLQSTVEFACTGGVDYVIQLGNYPGAFPPATGGAGTFDLSVVSPPANDDCSAPQTVVGFGSVAFDDSTATTGSQGQSEALCSSFGTSSIHGDLWYVWTAPFTATAAVSTCGSALDTKIAIYAGSGCPAGSAIACNDDACGLQSRAVFACTGGQTYTFQIGLFPGAGAGGNGSFVVAIVVPPSNDDCTAATAIGGFGPFAFDDTQATTGSQGQLEAQCNQLGGTAIRDDIWFVWTAPSTGPYSVQDLGLTAVDTKIAVYDGAGCPSAPSIACNDDANEPNIVYLQSQAVFQAVTGNSYTIQLGLSASTFSDGAGEFSILPVGLPANDDCSHATPIAMGAHAFDNTQATAGAEGQSELACNIFGSTSVSEDVWYTWTSSASGTATVSTCGQTTIDTKLAVYDGTGCPTGPALACNDDGCGGFAYQSEVTFPASCGQTYTLQLGVYPLYGAPAGGEGNFFVAVAGSVDCAPGVVFCAGDGVAPATSCPCGNDSTPGDDVGCLNSLGTGAKLRASGVPSVAGDTLVLVGTQMANSSCLYFQGTAQAAGGSGTLFGDGLRCAGGTVVRLGTETNVGGASQYPGPGQLPSSIKGMIPPAGGTRTYQCWYRNAAPFCTASTFNLTNGLELSWNP